MLTGRMPSLLLGAVTCARSVQVNIPNGGITRSAMHRNGKKCRFAPHNSGFSCEIHTKTPRGTFPCEQQRTVT